MLNELQKKYVDLLTNEPYKVAQWLGFTGITKELHNKWLVELIKGKTDWTLQAHRGSYKTTVVSVAFVIYMILFPKRNIIFMRKTDSDIVEIINQVQKILTNDVIKIISHKIYGQSIKIVKANASEITTNYYAEGTRGAVQLLGIGTKGSLTGKHAWWIHTDDIVNIKDRISRAERDFTKTIYMELQNIKMPGGRITNTGTPWHKEDCFAIMPAADKYDCYSTGLLDTKAIDELRKKMSPSLFAANYELKHISSEGALITEPPKFFDDMTLLENGRAHIDAAYGGSDGSVLTICARKDGKFYVLGKRKAIHIDKVIDNYIAIAKYHKADVFRCEDNGDKGYLARDIAKKGCYVKTYHEDMNKYVKISKFILKHWRDIYFSRDTDDDYLSEIMDYTEDAAHDDSPDSLASILRDYEILANRGY